MESYLKIFLRKLLEHKENLGEYVDSLYSDESKESDYNALFGELKSEGLLNVRFADNKAYTVQLTPKGKNLRASDLKLSDKEELLNLIDRTDEIGGLFHKLPSEWALFEEIHDVPEYQEWIQQVIMFLQEIFDRTHDQFIWESINACNRHMNGTDDRDIFIEIVGKLKSIAKNIDSYYEKETADDMGVTGSANHKQYDVFISHANQDKLDYVDELYTAINKLGIHIFYDKEELEWGDNWKDRILNGVQDSEFAIIVISENFFGSEWTERELDEFLNRQDESGQKIILPLLYNISVDDLRQKYPKVSDIQAISNEDKDVKDVAVLLARQLIKRYKGNCNGR